MSDFDTDTRTLSTKHGTLWLQTTLAIPFALLALCLLIAGMSLLMSLIQGDLRVLVPFLGVVAVGYASGALATSLYCGHGVPLWIMRAFGLSGVIGIAFLLGLAIRDYLNGVIDLGEVLMFVPAIYLCVSSRQIFWKPIGK
ncbi:MAG: hypothetical protein WCK15_13155 [Pirellula sp.]